MTSTRAVSWCYSYSSSSCRESAGGDENEGEGKRKGTGDSRSGGRSFSRVSFPISFPRLMRSSSLPDSDLEPTIDSALSGTMNPLRSVSVSSSSSSSSEIEVLFSHLASCRTIIEESIACVFTGDFNDGDGDGVGDGDGDGDGDGVDDISGSLDLPVRDVRFWLDRVMSLVCSMFYSRVLRRTHVSVFF